MTHPIPEPFIRWKENPPLFLCLPRPPVVRGLGYAKRESSSSRFTRKPIGDAWSCRPSKEVLPSLRSLSKSPKPRQDLGMSVLCQLAWSGKTTLRKRSVTVGTISNSAIPPRVTSIGREKTKARIGQLSGCRVALFPFSPPFSPPVAIHSVYRRVAST